MLWLIIYIQFLTRNPTSKLGERNNVDLIDVAPLTALGINGQVRWADCPHWAQWTPADLEEIQLVSGSLFYKLFLKISRLVNETNALILAWFGVYLHNRKKFAKIWYMQRKN